MLLGGTASLAMIGGAALARHSSLLMQRDFTAMSSAPLSMTNAMTMMQHMALSTLTAMAPFLVGVAGITLLVNMVQARGVVAVEGLQPKFERVSPIAGAKRLFVLTTRTSHWFMKRGFVQGGIADLPREKQNNYNRSRNSLVFIKKL